MLSGVVSGTTDLIQSCCVIVLLLTQACISVAVQFVLL